MLMGENHHRSGTMTANRLRLAAVAAVIIAMPCAAVAQGGGFLDNLFGSSDRVSPPPGQSQKSPSPAQAIPSVPDDPATRIHRLEAQVRQLTGMVEQLQHRNQQLEAQLRSVQGAPPPAGVVAPRQPATTAPPPQLPPTQLPPPAAPTQGRRGDAFDPRQSPSAVGAPKVLGTIPSGTVAQAQPQFDDDEIGAPGGRAAGAPLDLSTMAAPGGPQLKGPAGPPQPPRPPGSGGGQVATLPPSDSPRDHFDLAYGFIARKDYALAEDGFQNFLRRFPNDRLVPDAHYWLAESMFQRQRYRDAAETFLNVSTKFETHARAPDALLRLGQSLAAMGERQAACASLAEVLRKYPRASVAVRQSVDREQKRVRC